MSQPRPLLSPPETEEQLLAQAQQLSGSTLASVTAGLRKKEAMNLALPSGSSPPEKPPGWLRQRI